MAGPLNYTTTIDPARTVGECQMILGEHGADAIAVEFTARKPTGLRFMLNGQTYVLPLDVDGMGRALVKAHSEGRVKSISRTTALSREHAERVAWRVVKDWLEAQLALVSAQMVALDEVMLPYLVLETGRTLREQWRERLALPAGTNHG